MTVAEMPESERLDVGLRDSVDSGGFNYSTGEVRPGFVVSAADVVLEVGCGAGDGKEGIFCARRGAHVICSDIDEAQVRIAARRLADAGARVLTPIVTDTNPLPLPDGIATKVIAAEVMEHVDDPGQFLRELVRAGRPGAQYLLTVPDPVAENLQWGLAAPSHFQKPNHIRIIGRDQFATMATDAGLTIEHRGSYGFYRAMWWFFFWICKVDLFAPPPPLLESWTETWSALLSLPGGAALRRELNVLMPKSQYIVARKPGGTFRSAPISAQSDGLLVRSLRGLRGLLYGKPGAVAQVNGATRNLEPDYSGLFADFPIGPDDVVFYPEPDDPKSLSYLERFGASVHVGPSGLAAEGKATKVVAIGMIRRGGDTAAFLSELVNAGRSGAAYLLSESDPVYERLFSKLAGGDASPVLERDTFEQLVADAGLTIETRRYIGFYEALYRLFSLVCPIEKSGDEHPLLAHWARTWSLLLANPDGNRVIERLNQLMPTNQIIIARKP